MALVLGTNCGFVTVAPTSDPEANDASTDSRARALKDTSPSGAVKVTEIGWYVNNATEEANFELGIYDHNVGDDDPENLLAGVSRTNAKGTDAGWKVATGLDITISENTIYWIAGQLDNTATGTNIDAGETGRHALKVSQTTLTDPWASSLGFSANLLAIYAVVEAAAVTKNAIAMGHNF